MVDQLLPFLKRMEIDLASGLLEIQRESVAALERGFLH